MGDILAGALLIGLLALFIYLASKRPATSIEPPSDGLPIRDPFLRELYELQQRVLAIPLPSNPDELLQIQPFAELADLFSDSTEDGETALRYALGRDALLAWAALVALARRPRDPDMEERILGRINDLHEWSGHFIFRVLEAWNPDDSTLAARVLLRLNPSWSAPAAGLVLEDFLRRRAAVAPLSLTGSERPEGFSAADLRAILTHGISPSLVRPLLAELSEELVGGAESPSERLSAPESDPSSLLRVPSRLSEIGRVTNRKAATDHDLFGCPSADAQLERAVAALTGTPPRSALIVGEAGVGKTSLVRRIAARLSHQGWLIFEAGASQVLAGAAFIGLIEQRLQSMRHQLAQAKPALWTVPDFHQFLWSGRHLHSPIGLLEMLIPAIESGEIVMLGEVRPAALEKVLLERPEVARLFEIVRLDPPPETEIMEMLGTWAAAAAERSRVEIPRDLLVEAAALSRQYLSTQTPPGGVLRLLQGALARAQRLAARTGAGGSPSLTMDDLLEALAQLTGLPLDILDERRILDLQVVRDRFESRVIGQPEAVRCLVDRLALLKAGVTDPTRPTGVFLFAGGSGTGKTELAKTLAEYLFGSPERLIRIDMSELQDAHALDRLVGSAEGPGIGGNSLAERVRRQPFSIVLLDEFERAHPRVWDLFLQVFDDGRLTDHRGDTADFRQAIIILTSNLGTASWGEPRLGLVNRGEVFGPTAVERAVQNTFRPELLNRLDRQIVFRPLTHDIMRQILRKELADAFARRGLRRREWAIELEESAIELLIERGFSPTLGARPLKRALEYLLLTPLAAAIVDRSAPEGDQFLFVRADGDRLAVEFVDPDVAPDAGAPAARTAAGLAPTGLAPMVFEARGSRAEVEALRAALQGLQARVATASWSTTKEALLLESAAPGFWERADRFERLGRAEYMDRIESSLRSAASLLERLEGDPHAPRTSYPREMVRRLAQQLYLVEAACGEALETGPRDAFVMVEPLREGTTPPEIARHLARRVVDMYAAWARARGMRFTEVCPQDGAADQARVIAIAGFAAYALLAPEEGIHLLESDEPGIRGRSAVVRVRVEPQPPVPPRAGPAGLRSQAAEAFGSPAPLTKKVVRRYREQPSPLVRDLVRGWRTGRIERVWSGDFDVIPHRD